MIGAAQGLIFLVLGVACFALQVYALVNALRFRPDAYTAASKRTKKFWVIILVIAVALGFVSLPPPIGSGGGLGLLIIAATVAAGIFVADALPALRQVSRRGGRRSNNNGPYGPW